MKLRIKGNSLRLRLTQTEVKQFEASGQVAAAIHFGETEAAKMSYILQKTDAPEISASYKANCIQVNVPNDLAESWTKTNQVGLSHRMLQKEGAVLDILIEKDFKCLQTREGEVEADMFPNPDEGKFC